MTELDAKQELTPSQILVSQKEAAKMLGTTVGSLNVLRATGRNPIPFVRWGNRIRYRRDDIEKWIADNTVSGAR